jgi:hypothetical protein
MTESLPGEVRWKTIIGEASTPTITETNARNAGGPEDRQHGVSSPNHTRVDRSVNCMTSAVLFDDDQPHATYPVYVIVNEEIGELSQRGLENGVIGEYPRKTSPCKANVP